MLTDKVTLYEVSNRIKAFAYDVQGCGCCPASDHEINEMIKDLVRELDEIFTTQHMTSLQSSNVKSAVNS